MLPKSITYNLNEDGETYNVNVIGAELFDSETQENILVNYYYPKVKLQTTSMIPFLPQGNQEILNFTNNDGKDILWNMFIPNEETN